MVLVVGCGSRALPPPAITSVSPTTMVASTPTVVNVQVDAELPVQVDFGQSSLIVDGRMQVLVGSQPLGSGTYPPDGKVQGTLPTVFPTGTYRVIVTLGDGRSTVSNATFTVTDGLWPSAYSVEAIAEQQSGVAFPVTVHANGPGAAGFRGNVQLRLSGGGVVTPTVSSPFSSGVLVQTVTVTGSGTFVLLVDDIDNNHGQSAPFRVRP
jgi:hypothetical protein